MRNLFLFVAVIFISSTYAQETLNFDQAVTKCLSNNFSIQIIKKNVEISKNNNNIGNAGMLPSLAATGSIQNSNNDVNINFADGNSINQEGNNSENLNANVQLNWTIFDGFGMFISKNKLDALEELSEIDAQLQIENTLRNLVNLYFEAARQKQTLVALEENLEISADRYLRVKDKVDLGGAPKIDLLNAEVDLNQDSTNYLLAKINYENTLRNLNNLLGNGPDQSIDISLEEEGTIDLFTRDYIVDEAMKLNSSIMQSMKSQEISQYDYNLVKASLAPQINLSSSYGYSEMTTDAGWMVLNQSTGLTAGVSANINLFNGLRTSTQLQNAKINMQINDMMLQDVKNQVLTNIYNNYALYESRFEIWELEKQNLKTANINYQRTQELYHLGQSTSIDLRLAQLNLLNARNSQMNAYYQLKIAESELLIISGKLLKEGN
jgi:outer membrane protein